MKNRVITVLLFLILLAGSLTMVFPFLWMLSTALKDSKFVYQIPPQWIPRPVDWHNFVEIWSVVPLFNGLKNSFFVAGCVVLFGTLSSSMAAFSFSKLDFPYKDKIFIALLSSIMMPLVVMLIPQFIIYAKIRWIDTLLPLIIPGTLGNISMMFFLRQYMNGLSSELMDAAKLDGCGYLRIYGNIFLPLCMPAIAANVILLFMSTWNDYLGPLVYIHSPSRATVQVVIASLSSYYAEQTDFPIVMAASIVAILPVLLLFVTCQKYFVESFAMSGIKG
ncbi:MAG: carbohydrate ABC transporter permease [Treponema sp.]|nr:carbohydrate ABC transporter permease [Treponema sp.]